MRLRSLYLAGALAAMWTGADEIVLFDFTQGTHGWRGNARVTGLKSTPEGLAFACDGKEDPWIEGPPIAADFRAASVRLTLRLRTNGDAGGELFYGPRFVAGASVGVPLVPDGQWHDYSVVIPPQPEGTRLRFDPGGHGGDDIVLQSIHARVLLAMDPPPTTPPQLVPCAGPQLASGDLALRHSADRWGVFELAVDGKVFARSHSNDQIGVVCDEQATYLSLVGTPCEVKHDGQAIVCAQTVTDPAGGRWRLSRRFSAGRKGTILVRTEIVADRDREVFHLP